MVRIVSDLGQYDGNDSDDARAVDALRRKGKSKRKHLEPAKPARITKKKKKKKRAAGEPKRALSAYMFFCAEKREERVEIEGLSATEVLKKLEAPKIIMKKGLLPPLAPLSPLSQEFFQ